MIGAARWIAVLGLCSTLSLGCAARSSASENEGAGADGANSAGTSADEGAAPAEAAGKQADPPKNPSNAGSMASQPPPSSSSGMSGSAAPATGTRPAKAPLDPDIQFEWPESAPGSGGICEAGTYTGTFSCVFEGSIELAGPVSLTFSKSMDGEFLEIAEGNFEALSDLGIGGAAKIVGKLDCNTLMLDAMATEGVWTIGDPNAPWLPGGALEGQITGTLDPATGTLSGEWTFNDPALGACPGTWTVTYAP